MDGKGVARVQGGGARGLLEKRHDEAGGIQRGHGLLRHGGASLHLRHVLSHSHWAFSFS